MPTPTPAKRNTESRALLIGAAVLGAFAVLGGAVLIGARSAGRTAPPAATNQALAVPRHAGPAGASPRRHGSAGGAGAMEQAELAALVERDAEQALARISARTPADDQEAQHLKVLRIRALVALGRIGAARSEAAAYYQRWPDGPHVRELGRLTGRHPTPR